MARSVVTQLMFEGKAEEAMNLYVSLFKDAAVRSIERYGAGEPGAAGSVKRTEFMLSGHRLACIDSPVKHASASPRRPPSSSRLACSEPTVERRLASIRRLLKES